MGNDTAENAMIGLLEEELRSLKVAYLIDGEIVLGENFDDCLREWRIYIQKEAIDKYKRGDWFKSEPPMDLPLEYWNPKKVRLALELARGKYSRKIFRIVR